MDQIPAIATARHGRVVIDMGRGSSTFNVFDHLAAPLTPQDLRRCAPYGAILGHAELRAAICDHYQATFGHHLDPSRICVTNGASEGLLLALSLLVGAGDEVIIPEIGYPAYRALVTMLGGICRACPIAPDGRLDLAALRRLLSPRTQALIVNSPSNPLGRALSREALESIADLGVTVLYDEVYQPLPIDDERELASAIHLSERHFVVNSLSKSVGLAGLRVGYLVVPPGARRSIADAKAALNISTQTPGQLVALAVLRRWDELVRAHRTMLRAHWSVFLRALARNGLRLYAAPEAGFFATIDTRGAGIPSYEIAAALARMHGLCTVPGSEFGGGDPGFLRLNFSCHADHIEPALAQIGAFLEGRRSACANGR
ncbi:MAG: pyridoxal phosphate-dependent aminotransferase [Nannocystaceae bacterium]